MNRDFKNAQGKQIRTCTSELRAEGRDNGASDEFSIVGYAARYNVQSHNLGGFRETIAPKAFQRSVRDQMQGEGICALWNHDASQGILGRTTAGTMTVSEDDKGLRFKVSLDRNQELHRSIFSSIKRGDTNGVSFAFTVAPHGQSWAQGYDPETKEACAFRTLTDVDLIECSPCAFPAYPNTSVDARSRADYSIYVDARHAIATMRKLAQSDARLMKDFETLRELRTSPKYPYGSPDGMAALERIYAHAARCAELASFCSDLVNDTLATWDTQDDDDRSRRGKGDLYPYNQPGDDDVHNFRCAHTESHAAISGACESFAKTRLALGRCTKPNKFNN